MYTFTHGHTTTFSCLDVAATMCTPLIEKMTGIEPEMDSTLDEVGLASVGIPVIVGDLYDHLKCTKQMILIAKKHQTWIKYSV